MLDLKNTVIPYGYSDPTYLFIDSGEDWNDNIVATIEINADYIEGFPQFHVTKDQAKQIIEELQKYL